MDIKLVTTERRRNYLLSEPNYHTTEFFTENLISNRNEKKNQILMNMSVYLRFSILDLSKAVMYEFWYYYLKSNYGENIKLCYMDTGSSFIVHVKTDGMSKDIAKDAEIRFDTLTNFEIDRLLPQGKYKKVIELMKDELGGKIMKEFVALRAKTYSCLKENNDKGKKASGTKKCIIKRKLKFQDYKNCSNADKIDERTKYLKKRKN